MSNDFPTTWPSLIAWFLMVFFWLGGMVLAKSYYVIIAFCLPPYGWYLVVERIMQLCGLV